MSVRLEFPLRGAGGEPVDLWRTIVSHGVASLPPMHVDEERRTLEATLSLRGSKPRTVQIRSGRAGRGVIEVSGPPPSKRTREAILRAARHVLRMDEDLSGFYARIAGDPALSWAAAGAGRMIRSQTVFEDVVKTICTTNCAWSATERMVGALVEHLGERAPGSPASGGRGRAFPRAEAMASAGDDFYREVVRAGYRGPYLRSLAQDVAGGGLDLEALASAGAPSESSDEEVFATLLSLPGVGPYAAAHIMMMIGRSSRLILDSWTRPKYARLTGRRASDETIQRRFRRYGSHAGLAFWLFLTRDWVDG